MSGCCTRLVIVDRKGEENGFTHGLTIKKAEYPRCIHRLATYVSVSPPVRRGKSIMYTYVRLLCRTRLLPRPKEKVRSACTPLLLLLVPPAESGMPASQGGPALSVLVTRQAATETKEREQRRRREASIRWSELSTSYGGARAVGRLGREQRAKCGRNAIDAVAKSNNDPQIMYR